MWAVPSKTWISDKTYDIEASNGFMKKNVSGHLTYNVYFPSRLIPSRLACKCEACIKEREWLKGEPT